MVAQTQGDKPVFKGLNWYRDQYFSVFVPMDWQRAPWSDGRHGVLFQPDATDSATLLAVEVKDMDTTFSADDLEDLKAGFLEGIEALPESKLLENKHWLVGDTISLEAKFSYLEQKQTRKRWIRVFYNKNRQTSFIAQGASSEDFAYWLPMFYQAMMTARIHDQKPELKAVVE